MKFKKLSRYYRSKRSPHKVAALTLILCAFSAYIIMSNDKPVHMNYSQLLDTIATGESNGNYNAYFRHPDNTSVDFTAMSIDEVINWQKQYVEQGSPSSAVGKYQFIRPTLERLVNKYTIDRSEKFDAAMQDRLAVALIEERGAQDFAKGKMKREEFAHNLSKEWAALPRAKGDDPHLSYYAGDGLNKERVKVEEIFSSIDSMVN